MSRLVRGLAALLWCLTALVPGQSALPEPELVLRPIAPGESLLPNTDIYRLVTWHVPLIADPGADPILAAEGLRPRSAESDAAIASVLRALDADLVALQGIESRGELERFVAAHLGGLRYTVAMDEAPDAATGQVALLSRYPVVAAMRYGDPMPDEPFGPVRHRLVLYEIELSPEYTLWLVVCHLPGGDDDVSAAWRDEMALAAREILTRIGIDPDESNVAIAGSFNAQPGSTPVAAIIREGVFVDGLIASPNPDLTYPSSFPARQLDFIFVSRGLRKESIGFAGRVAALPDIPTVQAASDHLPVVLPQMVGETSNDGASPRPVTMLRAARDGEELVYRQLMDVPQAADLIVAEVDRRAAEALAGGIGGTTPIAAARAAFLELEASGVGGESVVVLLDGVAQCDDDSFNPVLRMFGLADHTGAIMVDAANRSFFGRPVAAWERVRVGGRIERERDMLMFRPVAAAELFGMAAYPNSPPFIPVDVFASAARRFEGGRVVLTDGYVAETELMRDESVKYTVRSLTPGSTAEAIVFVPATAKQKFTQVTRGEGIIAGGIVTIFRDTPQIVAVAAGDLFERPLPSGAISPVPTAEAPPEATPPPTAPVAVE